MDSIRKLTDYVFEDLQKVTSQVKISEISDFDKRNLFRIAFSSIEGLLFVLKTEILKRVDERNIDLTNAEKSILFEESYYIKNNGAPASKPLFISTKDNIRSTFLLSNKIFGIDFEPNYVGKNGMILLSLIKKGIQSYTLNLLKILKYLLVK